MANPATLKKRLVPLNTMRKEKVIRKSMHKKKHPIRRSDMQCFVRGVPSRLVGGTWGGEKRWGKTVGKTAENLRGERKIKIFIPPLWQN